MAISKEHLIAARQDIEKHWGSEVLTVIDRQTVHPMTLKEFLTHCTACGGNWGGMFLSGINDIWPEVYDAIPSWMGSFAFSCICSTMNLLGVDTSGEE